MSFADSYQGKLRQKIGHDLILMPGASALVQDDANRILLTKRTDAPIWCMPGGAAEVGSSFASTAATELYEETGLLVDEQDLVAFCCISDPKIHILSYPSGDVTHAFAIWFLVRKWSGELRSSSNEVKESGFFDFDDLPSPLLKPTAHAIRLFKEFERTGKFQIS